MERRKCIGFFCAIITAFVALMGNVKAVSLSRIDKRNGSNTTAFDIYATTSTEGEIQTTYDNYGYGVSISIEGESNVYSITKDDFGVDTELGDNTGIKVLVTSSETQGGKGVLITYKITNTTPEAKQVKLAVDSDIQIAENDEAAVSKTEDHSKIIMTQDYDYYSGSYRARITINFEPVATTTWIGNYSYRDENYFNDGTKLSYINVDEEDTGMTFSWTVDVPANDSKSVTSEFVASEAPVTTAKFYKYNDLETPFETKEVVVGGSLMFPANTPGKDGVYYHWNTKKDGTGTSYDTVEENGTFGILLTDENASFYEFDYYGKLRMYYTDTEYYELDKDDTLPPVFVQPPEGKYLEGVYLDPDFKTPLTGDKMPDKDIHVYYHWVDVTSTLEGDFIGDFDEMSIVDISKEEQDKIDAGSTFDLILKVNDISNIVTDAEKELVAKKLIPGATPLMYFDASLFKVYSGGDSVVVNKTKQAIKIGIEIPEEMANSGKPLALARVHNGEITIIYGTIEEIDGKKILTFLSDKFSTYAIVYADEVVKNPKTGDNVLTYVALLVISALSLGAMLELRRNN